MAYFYVDFRRCQYTSEKQNLVTTDDNNWIVLLDYHLLLSRHPFVPTAQQPISFSDNNNIRAAQWPDHQWNVEWTDNPTRLRTSIPDTGTHTPGMTLPRRAWVRLNRLLTGVGRFRSCLYKWGMASSAACECGAEKTVDHVVLHCPIRRPPTDYPAWRFWTMRQPNGSSTPAPICRRASSG